MSRRQSSSNAAIDLGIARSTDFGAPPVSSRVSPKWRAPRPLSWPPPLPAHRIPGSAPRSAPPNRFHEPVLHAPVLTPYVEPRRPRAGLWAAIISLVAVIAATSAGFAFRDRLLPGAVSASTWLRGQLPSDLAERPRIAWTRIRELAAQSVSKARSLATTFGAPRAVSAARATPPATSNNVATETSEHANTAAHEAPVVDVSALPLAAPLPAPRSAPRYRPAAQRDVSPSAPSEDAPTAPQPAAAAAHASAASEAPETAAPTTPAAAPVHTASAPPVHAAPAPSAPPAAPAPEPGSLDDLIRKTVERESHLKH
jgi:hypothetical protein